MARADSTADVFAEASSRIRRLVPFDAAAWITTDPATGLPTAPVRIDGLDDITRQQCAEHWQREFVVDDVNLFRDLARAPVPAAGLHAAIDDPRQSPRYRQFLRPLGFDDELRAVLRAGGSPWGTMTLWRRQGRAPFTREEADLIAGLSVPLGDALRLRARPPDLMDGSPAGPRGGEAPGLMVFDTEAKLLSIDAHARAWLAELPAEPAMRSDLDVAVPVWVLVTVLQAAAVRHGHGDGTARARVRTGSGHWLVCHASCLSDADGDRATTALVLDAANPAEIAPLVVDAFDLTDREQQITRLIARGAGTAEIADTLHLSPHTVRDHVKAIFTKTGVTSRGELVAKLYTEFYGPSRQTGTSPPPAAGTLDVHDA